VFLMYIFGGCSDSVNVDGGSAVKGVKMEIGVAVSQGTPCALHLKFFLDLRAVLLRSSVFLCNFT
jgi:hypothetical protein